MRLCCVRSLTKEEDGNVVEHPRLVEVGVEHHLMMGVDDGVNGEYPR